MFPEAIDKTEYFDWQGIRICQHEDVHKVGTDSVLLGSWVQGQISAADLILDVGTGTGILALMMARCYAAAKIRAVDIDQQALQLAGLNVSNAFALAENRIIVCYENILAHPTHSVKQYDLIISNPPFYDAQVLPEKEAKAKAKHSMFPVADWMKGMLNRLSATGYLCIIVPSASAVKWISAANENGYHNLNRLDVFSFENDPLPKRSLLLFGAVLNKPAIDRVVIYTRDNNYTDDYLNLTGIRSKV